MVAARGGDDLEDDYDPDELVAQSEEEYLDNTVEFAPLEGEEDQFVADDDAYTPTAKDKTVTSPLPLEEAKQGNKRKKRAKDNERKAKKQRLTLVDEGRPNDSTITAAQPPSVIASLLKKGQIQALGDLTQVELEDISIPESCIVDTSSWKGERKHDNLGGFIREVVPTLAARIDQESKNNGAPTCLMLSGNANRVTDLTRAFRPLRGEKSGEVCKLFARHFRLVEHAEHLKKTKVGVAVGTPGRISALLNDTDSLVLKALSHIILDVTYMDSKNKSMLDTLETKEELFKKFFTNKKILERLRNGKCSLVIF